jgi:signal transduction histidine kinase
VAVLLAGCLLFTSTDGRHGAVDAVLQVGLILPLLWRRRAPFAVFAVVVTVAFVQWLVAVPLPADLALLVALFTLAVHDTPARALGGAGVLEVGVLIGSVRWTPVGDAVLASVVFLSGMVAAALFVGLTLRTWRAYMDSLVERANRLELERDQRARLAAATERSRIAREMHDVVAHNVSIMVALAEGARAATVADPAGAAEAMGEVSSTGRMALADMRNLLGVLRDQGAGADRAPQPGLSALPALIEGVRSTGLAVELVERGAGFEVPPGIGLTIYRMVQESLTNVLKHADRVSRVVVTIEFEHPWIGLRVRDDGASAGPSGGPGRRAQVGHGLRGMRERAAVGRGTLTAGPHPGGGWEVEARMRVEGALVG